MISINVPKQEVKTATPAQSLSQQKYRRDAKREAEKKMTVEKYERLKRAGIVK